MEVATVGMHAELEEFKIFEAQVKSGDEDVISGDEEERAEGPAPSPKKMKNKAVTKILDVDEEYEAVEFEACEFEAEPRQFKQQVGSG
jgi:hypothetical protein